MVAADIVQLETRAAEIDDVAIADADIVPANLDSIDRIAGFIARKQAA